MNKFVAVALGVVLVVSLLLFSMTYTVSYHEIAIKTRFGQSDDSSIVREAGLKFRLPFFADKITHLDKRLQMSESPLTSVETADRLQVVARAYLLWQIDDDGTGDGPLRFFQHYETVERANQELRDTFRNALLTGVSRFKFDDLIGPDSKVSEAEKAVAREMQSVVADGIKPVMVGISQIVLTPKTSTAVLNRMRQTNKTISETERIKGNAEAQGIQNRAAQIAAKIESFAKTRASEIREAGSMQAAEYLRTMSKDQPLAVFLAWLDALQSSLSEHTTVVIPAEFAPFHMMNIGAPTDARGIPQPPGAGAPPPQATKPSVEPRDGEKGR